MTASKNNTKTNKDDENKEIAEQKSTPKSKGTCFVIMPISDNEGYDIGHFDRVYEKIFKPAIIEAGYKPERADEQKTNNIILGIIESIVNSEMVLCDLSSNNPNVLYELGMRNAFETPVVLVKDERTSKIFDISVIRYCDYHSSLRVDIVEENIKDIYDAIVNYTKDKESYSLMSKANIQVAPEPESKAVNAGTELILDEIRGLSRRINAMENRPERESNVFPQGLAGAYKQVIRRDIMRKFPIGENVYDSYGKLMGAVSGYGYDYVEISTLNSDGFISVLHEFEDILKNGYYTVPS